MQNTRKIFLGSNTPDGFVGWFDQIVDNYNLKRLYILKGGSGVGKSTFIKKFANALGGDTTFIMCSADPTSFDGAILHDHGVAIIDGTFPHITDPKYPGMVEEIIDLAQFLERSKIKISRSRLQNIMARRRNHFQRAFAELEKARFLHHQVEGIFSSAMYFDGVEKLLNETIKKHK